MATLLSDGAMRFAVQGVSYIGHPLRLRIIEYLDVYGASCVSDIAKGVGEEQMIVSQSLKKLREAELIKAQRKGIFVYYDLNGEYPASIFVCVRKLYGYITDSFKFLTDGYKGILPKDFTMLTANQIKLFANFDKMRILEYLAIAKVSCVGEIAETLGIEQLKISQYLKKMRDEGFVKARKEGRFVYYEITKGIHKTVIQCIHKKFGDIIED